MYSLSVVKINLRELSEGFWKCVFLKKLYTLYYYEGTINIGSLYYMKFTKSKLITDRPDVLSIKTWNKNRFIKNDLYTSFFCFFFVNCVICFSFILFKILERVAAFTSEVLHFHCSYFFESLSKGIYISFWWKSNKQLWVSFHIELFFWNCFWFTKVYFLNFKPNTLTLVLF